MTAVIDTCVLLDVLTNREPFFKNSYNVFLAASYKKYIGFITAKSVLDLYYMSYRTFHSDQQTRNTINKIFPLFKLADTTAEDCRIAIYSQTSDFEDAVMIETAKRINADCIVTRNLRDYSVSPIPVFSPEDFLKMLDPGEQNADLS